jgi:nicotinamide-nucleotide amidase
MNDLATLIGVPVDVVADLIKTLADRELTVATAESLTGGLLAALLTEIPGSSAVVRGGLVVYASDLKQTLAGVDARLLTARGPVDPDVAEALARGARERCGADIGVGLTGVAGPDQQNGIAVGTWFCAVAGPGNRRSLRTGAPEAPPATTPTRAAIRAQAVRAAVDLLANIAATDS